MTTSKDTSEDAKGPSSLALELEVEEIADLEIPKTVADDVHGASGTPAPGQVVGKQNC